MTFCKAPFVSESTTVTDQQKHLINVKRCFSWKRIQDIFDTVKTAKVASVVLRHKVCDTCKVDRAQASILFRLIFIVGLKFSERLLSRKIWFFFLGWDADRMYFSIIWTEMIPLAQFIQHFTNVLAGHPFCGHWAIPKTKNKKTRRI